MEIVGDLTTEAFIGALKHPTQLVENNHWFYGPRFLHSSMDTWTNNDLNVDQCTLEQKNKSITKLTSNIATAKDDALTCIDHRSSFRRLQRVIAYMLRLTKPNIPGAKLLEGANKAIRVEEMEDALLRIIKHIQTMFADQITHINKYGTVQHNSSISHLTPFVDERGILRVGGRLEASNLAYDAKHPILLSHLHPLTKLLLNELHKENLHAGVQTLLAISRQRFWIINGKTLARNIIHNCVHCTRAKPRLMQQLMGNLPKDRVVPARPFITTGVDFFGPVYIHYKIRGKRPQKAYVSVFCCFSTKAVHMEIVGDLTTEAFIGALKRFMGRRGHCQRIYCDNATNFTGTRSSLEELQKCIHNQTSQDKIIATCSKSNIEFKFIPPRAPHFGGLWEAAVKAAKSLMKKTLDSASLTYEEMETVIIEAEAILNSRPLTPMSSDPNDMTALTPGHFLIGEALTSTVDQHAAPNNANLIKRWKLVTYLKSEFWRRWSSEYLQQLQHRYRWKQRCENVKPGMMVILKEDNLPPLRWPLGRITRVIPGEDGIVRVVDVRTANSIFRRPIHRLAPLPHNNQDNANDAADNTDVESSDNKNKDQHKRFGSTRKRKSSLNITTLLLTCLLVPIIYGTSVEIHSFKSNPGIYFEQLGMAKIISNDWNLVNYFDLQPYQQEYEITQRYISMLSPICDSINNRTSCQKTITQIQRQAKSIEANNAFFKRSDKLLRIRRGAFNFVGNLANGLFGVLDSEYAEKLATTIDNMKQNDETLRSGIQNQTKFLDRTLSIMRRNQINITQEFNSIEKLFYKTNQQLKNVTYQVQLQQIAETFHELALHVFIHLSNFQNLQDSIIDMLTDAHHGRINQQLLTPKELLAELETVKVSHAKSSRLPLATTDIEKYYRIMSISHKLTAKYMIFNIQIPLTTSTQYEILKLTAVPWYQDNTFQKITLSTPYLLVDLIRDHYHPLSKDEVQHCMSIDNQFLCHQTQPLYNRDAEVASCEMGLLRQARSMTKCNLVSIGDGPVWTSLLERNSWIYAVKTATQLNVVCKDKPSQLSIEEIGILKVGDGCMVKTSHITIEGHATIVSARHVTYVPTVDISQLTKPSDANMTTMNNYTSNYQPINGIEELQKQISDLKSISFNTVRPHDIHHYGLGYILLVGVTVLGVYTIWYRRSRSKEWLPTMIIPKPTPRNISSQSPIPNDDSQSHIVTIYDS